MTDTPVIEAQLLRWSESHNGRTVTLQLPADGEHPFRGLPCGPANGQRLAIAIALIADNETTTPVEPPSTAPEKPKGGRLAQQAGICCQDARFRRFLIEQEDLSVTPDGPINTETVAEAVRILCRVNSRSELDSNPDAAARWQDLHGRYIVWRDNP